MFCAIKSFREGVTGRSVYTKIKTYYYCFTNRNITFSVSFGWGRSRLDGEDVGTRRIILCRSVA